MNSYCKVATQALHGLATKCKLINALVLIKIWSTNYYVILLPLENGKNLNIKGFFFKLQILCPYSTTHA